MTECELYVNLPRFLFLRLRFHLLHLHGIRLSSPHEQIVISDTQIQNLKK